MCWRITRSTALSNLEIELKGKGVVSDATRPPESNYEGIAVAGGLLMKMRAMVVVVALARRQICLAGTGIRALVVT